MRLKKHKKADFSMSFNMLFSIILIAVFVALAIYVINYFLKIQCSISLGSFKDNLQKEVDRMWKSDTTGKSNEKYRIGSIGRNCAEQICFFNTKDKKFKGIYSEQYDELIPYVLKQNNLYFYPIKKSSKLYFEIKNLDTSNIENNPQCFSVEKGIVKIPLEKGSSDALVKLSN
ncbi:MAG TPA: hypothetical protein P5277_02795 [Candidatus Paceibacterota bacterium]|nr:hypothetical protein [Candidatus Paceibacterota bacterium]